MLMVPALQVTSQLIQQGSWAKGKHMAVTSCIYNVLWALGSKSWWSPGWQIEARE